MEITAKVITVLPIESGTSKSGKTWSKARIVVETEGQYPKKILLTNFKDADKFAMLPVGVAGTFSVDIESREWTNQNTGRSSWFTEVNCYKWNVGASQVASQPQQAPMQQGWQAAYPQPQQYAQPTPPPPTAQGDGLPF